MVSPLPQCLRVYFFLNDLVNLKIAISVNLYVLETKMNLGKISVSWSILEFISGRWQ